MGFDRKRRGKGRDKRDNFGDENFDGYGGPPPLPGEIGSGGFDDRPKRGGFNNDRGGDRGGFNNDRGGGFGGPRGGGSRPSMPAQVVGTGSGVVKFFNAQKGFGFIQCDDKPDDVFVHISAVEQAGLQGLAEGQPLEFTLVDRGGKTSATDLVIDGEPMPVPDRPQRDDRGGDGGFERKPRREPTGERANGTVKFFNDMKGFGFIERDDGGEDAFVHISALERSGMGPVEQGDRLAFDIEVDQRGKYSASNLAKAES